MLYCLWKLYTKFGREAKRSAEIEPIEVISSDFAKLRYWGLIAKVETHGWTITDFGVDFLEGKVPICKYVWLRNGKPQPTPAGMKNPPVWAKEVIPEIVNKYTALMNSMPQSKFEAEAGDNESPGI
jgi:hypothetical protein